MISAIYYIDWLDKCKNQNDTHYLDDTEIQMFFKYAISRSLKHYLAWSSLGYFLKAKNKQI